MDLASFLIWNGLSLGAAVLLGALFLNRQRRAQKAEGGDAAENDNEKGSPKVKDAPRGPLRIYFGSQTGTAETFAKSLEHEGRRLGFGTYLVDMEDWNPKQVEMPSQCPPSLFVMATFGEGDPTDNATEFFIWLDGGNPDEVGDGDCEGIQPKVPHLSYAVFGLGNGQYEFYNRSGRRTDQRLELRGGKRVAEYGEGNEDESLDEDFDVWKEKLWVQLCEVFGGKLPEATKEEDEMPEEPVFSLNYLSSGHSVPTVSEVNSASSTRFFWQAKACRVLDTVELRAETHAGGSTKHVVLDLKGAGLEYTTADNIAVCPENPKEMVNLLCRSQGYKPDEYFTMDMGPSHKAPFPTPCTVAECLTSYVDIMAIPRALTLASLVSFATDSSDRERLRHISSREGRDDYRSFILDEKRCLGELLCFTFPSIRVPLNHLLNIIPPPHPREYTGANGGKSIKTEVHLAVSVLQKTLNGGREWKGLCSSFLANLKPGDQCRVVVRPSGFRLPRDPDRPVIMIGPGTGVAPMRALSQDLQQVRRSELRRTRLYFGCRSESSDYLYRTDLENFVRDETLTYLRTAFSRDQPQKIYVQHLLEQDGYDVFQDLYEGNGHLYVCGGTSMGADVATMISELCVKHGNMDDAGAKAFIAALHQEGRYVQELWS